MSNRIFCGSVGHPTYVMRPGKRRDINSAKSRQHGGSRFATSSAVRSSKSGRDPVACNLLRRRIRRADISTGTNRRTGQVEKLSPSTANGWLRPARRDELYVHEYELDRTPSWVFRLRHQHTPLHRGAAKLATVAELRSFGALAKHHPRIWDGGVGVRHWADRRSCAHCGGTARSQTFYGTELVSDTDFATVGTSEKQPKTGLRQRLALPKDLMEIGCMSAHLPKANDESERLFHPRSVLPRHHGRSSRSTTW